MVRAVPEHGERLEKIEAAITSLAIELGRLDLLIDAGWDIRVTETGNHEDAGDDGESAPQQETNIMKHTDREAFTLFRRELREALYPYWPNNPGVGNDEIVAAVRRAVAELSDLQRALSKVEGG